MALSIENIKFIDNYLKYDIEYIDVRMEMIDHIASEIEEQVRTGDKRSFYYIFKDYMVKNKARLINENKKFKKLVNKKVLRMLMTNLIKPFSIITFIISTILFYSANNYNTDLLNSILSDIPVFCFIIIILTLFIFTIGIRKKRYSSFDQLTLFLMIIMFINQFLFFGKNNILEKLMLIGNLNLLVIFINSLNISITSVFIYTIIQIRKEYNNRFEKIV